MRQLRSNRLLSTIRNNNFNYNKPRRAALKKYARLLMAKSQSNLTEIQIAKRIKKF